MHTIARLFGKSPFALLQSHMEKVNKCLEKLREIFIALEHGKHASIDSLVHELSKLEHEADLTKNDIRNHLPKSLFLQIERGELLEILAIQDTIADKAEEIGHLVILHPMQIPNEFYTKLKILFEKNLEAYELSRMIIKEMHDLLESTFGGMEAEKVKSLIEMTSFKEYEADKLKHALISEFFKIADSLSTPTFYLYMKLIEHTNALSHISEHLASKMRLLIEAR